MTNGNTSGFVDTCREAARSGGAVLLNWIGRFEVREKGPSDLVTEADVASQEAIRRVVMSRYPTHQFISEEDPGESMWGGSADQYRWIVDPLDGTMNYVHGVPHYCVSIALVRGEEIVVGAIYEPHSRDCYWTARGEGAWLESPSGRKRLRTAPTTRLADSLVAASFSTKVDRTSAEVGQFFAVLLECQGVRRTGSAALNMCYVAAGRFDGFWALSTKAWDVAAGALLVTEAGGVVTDLQGQPFNLRRPHPVATAGNPLHEAFRQLLVSSAANWSAPGE